MNHATIGPALKTWAAALTGVAAAHCVWENEPRPRHDGSLVLLRWVSESPAGVDATHYTFAANADPLAEMTPTTTGNRVLALQLDIEVDDQRPGVNAHAVASRARTRLHWPRLLAMLDAVELAVAGVGQIITADYSVDDHVVSRRVFEVRLHAVARETDPAGTTSYIATVNPTASITNPAGVALPAPIQPGGTLP